ncbi:hypothetical protein NDU88_003735 [Pleurodeles waltl]|uniref:Uncharacterized protein n=1 Tax=Pleurodeles waltl TaxID=8319 RepID=A0AAV7NJ20_PLEWA|nr:hypothetical protein NDU88_003735 [Pleurodeles waltl]
MDPSCSEGVDSAVTSGPEVQHTSANPRSRPGNERQRKPFRAVTRLHNSEGSDESGADECRTLSWETAKEDRDDKEGGGCAHDGRPNRRPSRRLEDPNQRHERRPAQALATLGEKHGLFRWVAFIRLRYQAQKCPFYHPKTNSVVEINQVLK